MSILNLNEDDNFKAMRECFQDAGLPVFKDPCLCDNNPNKLKSMLIRGALSIYIDGSYDPVNLFAKVKFCLNDPIDSKDFDATRIMINSMNAGTPFYHYSLCPCCNNLEISSGLYNPMPKLFKRRFKIILLLILDEINHVYPSMIQAIRSGRDCEALIQELASKDGSLSTEENSSINDVTADKKLNKVLKTMEQVLMKMKLLTEGRHINTIPFTTNIILPEHDDFKATLAFFARRKNLVLSMSPPIKIPDDKIISVMDLINRFNNIIMIEHLWLSSEPNNNIIIMKSIILPKMVLNKDEFEWAIHSLVGQGVSMIGAVLEHIASNQTPEASFSCWMSKHLGPDHNVQENEEKEKIS